MKRLTIRRFLILVFVGVAVGVLYHLFVETDNSLVVAEQRTESKTFSDWLPLDHRQLLEKDVTLRAQEEGQPESEINYFNLSPVSSRIIELQQTTNHHLPLKETHVTELLIPASQVRLIQSKFNKSSVVNYAAPLLSDDDFIRNCITNDIVGQIPNGLRTAAFRSVKAIAPETADDRKQSFKKVFDTRAWGHSWDAQNRGLNASGMGATLQWTQETIGALHVVINQLKLAFNVSRIRLLDVPCGDMAWMSRFLKTRNDIDYTGVDIVPDLIQHHQNVFKGFPWKFQLQDIVTSPMTESYHLIVCRTLLQHLYDYDIFKVLERFSTSQSAYLMMTSFFKHKENQELVVDSENPGRFRRINLGIKPFSLVPPCCIFRDGPPDVFEGWDHFMGLWKLPLRRVRRCNMPTEIELKGSEVKIYYCTNWSLT